MWTDGTVLWSASLMLVLENTDARVSKEGGFCYEFHILHRLLALAVTQCRVFGCTNELEERREATVRLPMGRCFQPRPHLPFDAQVSSNRQPSGMQQACYQRCQCCCIAAHCMPLLFKSDSSRCIIRCRERVMPYLPTRNSRQSSCCARQVSVVSTAQRSRLHPSFPSLTHLALSTNRASKRHC